MRFVPTMKERDKGVILAVARQYGPLSRVEIHQLTHLRHATISELVRELLDAGKLVEAGPSDNPLGRKQVLLQINEKAGFVVGIDFDVEFVEAALMDLQPSICAVVKEATLLESGSDGLIQQLLECTQKVIHKARFEINLICGIGVGDPGLVNDREGMSIFSSTIEFWKEIPLQKIFEEKLGVPTVVGNNTRTKTVAERVLGVGNLSEDMIYVEYGRGIGAGIITGGRVLQGHRWSAGEFGHTHILENGPACNCGSFGCLEAMAGIGALESRIRRAIAQGGNTSALRLAGGDPAKVTGWTVLQAARLGDKMCLILVEELADYLGVGIANLVNLFNPSLIVLDQRLELAGQDFLDQISRVVKRRALEYASEDLVFQFGKLGSEVGVLGAGLLVLETLFEVPIVKPPRFMIDPSITVQAPRQRRRACTTREETALTHPVENG